MSIIEISLDADDALQKLIKIKARMEDMTPINKEISEKMVKSTQLNFKTQGERLGKRWKELAPATIRQRSRAEVRVRNEAGKYSRYKKGKKAGQYKTRKVKPTWPGKILIISGQLLGSVIAYYGKDYAGAGTNKVYGRIHQEGGKAGKGRRITIDPRPYFGLNEQDKEDIRRFVAKQVLSL